MKIAHIIPTLNAGGAEKLIYDSAQYYSELGYQVDVIVLRTTDSFFLHDLKKKINVIELGKGSVYNPFHIFKLKKYLINYDLIHLHLFPVLYFCVFAKLLFGLKTLLVYTEHSTSNKRRNNLFFQTIDRWVYSKLNFIGCISNGTRINLINHLGTVPVPIDTIHNGVDLHVFKDSFLNQRRFFSENDFVLVQVSSFRIEKDQKTLIRSLKRLNDEIKLILVGEGSLRKECESLVSELDLNNRVIFLGIRNDIPLILSESNVVILSSNIEGFGIAIVEGMAMGKPVIASNIDGLNDVVKDYGLLFEKGNDLELASHINKLYSNTLFYADVSKRCFERSQDFDIRKMVDSYSQIYKTLIRNNK